jgi:hypothetical protein
MSNKHVPIDPRGFESAAGSQGDGDRVMKSWPVVAPLFGVVAVAATAFAWAGVSVNDLLGMLLP